MSPTAFGVLLLFGLTLYVTVVSVVAVVPRRRVRPDAIGPLPNRRTEPHPVVARLRDGAVVGGLALGMAMATGRAIENQVFESWLEGSETWIATMLPPPITTTNRRLRIQPRALPR